MPQEWQGWVKVDWRPHLGTWRAGDPLKLLAFLSSLPILFLPGKIEIKIVRPGAEGKEEDTRWLTDEDTRNLKEIFFNILVRHPTHIPAAAPTTVLLKSGSVMLAIPTFLEPHPLSEVKLTNLSAAWGNPFGGQYPQSCLPSRSQDLPHSTALASSQVQGAEEASKERQRQSELESNYRRVWGSPSAEDTGDLEEFDF